MTAFKDWLNGLTSKTTPVDADELYVMDSSGTPGSKKLTWANLKATLANTFLSLTGGTIAGGTRTSSGSTLTITETLNNAGVTFPGALVVDVTDTASAAGSLLMDLKVGGVSKLAVKKQYGVIQLSDANGTVDFYSTPGNIGGQYSLYGTRLRSSATIEWSSSNSYINAPNDLVLLRDAANTLAQRNGTNAQTFRLYNTYTDASNYERGFMRFAEWNNNVLEIGTEKAGTGATRNIEVFIGTTRQAHYEQDVSVNRNWFGISSTGYDSGNRFFFNPVEDAVCRLASRVGGSPGAAMQFVEMTAPAAPATNSVRIYAEDNGSGKTRLMALFATGAAVQIAIEP